MLRPVDPAAPLLLGSGSPRRREILGAIGVPFVVRAADADERLRPGEDAGAYLERVVLAKLAAVCARLAADEARADRVVLVADTAVIEAGDVLGKPTSDEDGYRMIARLRGKTHEVRTRFLLATGAGDALHAETVGTRVTFRAIDDVEARAYAACGEGRDKAGGYAVQGRGAAFVPRIEGSYANVVGLPACEVAQALRRLGLVG